MNDNTPIHQLGVFSLTITNVQKKEISSWKGKEFPAAYVVTLEHEDGRLIDDKFKLPFTEEKHKFDKKRLEDLMKLLQVKTVSELKGKKAAVLVEPFEFQGKVLWNPKKYYHPKYLLSPSEGLNENPFGDISHATESIPF